MSTQTETMTDSRELEFRDAPPELPRDKDLKVQQLLVIGAGFTIMLTTNALIFSAGVYQALYEEMASEPDNPFTGASSALIGLIGTLAIGLMSMTGPFVMMWIKLYRPQAVVAVAGVIFGVAYILASVSRTLWQFALTQGVLVGISVSMSYIPATTTAPTWFNERRSLAMGIVISGSAVGGMIWPSILTAMINRMGFRNALRVSGAVCALAIILVSPAVRWEPSFNQQILAERQALLQRRGAGSGTRSRALLQPPPINWRLTRTRKFLLKAAGCMLQSAAYSTPLIYYAAFGRALGYSAGTAANFITISNAANAVARVALGYAADQYGRMNLLFATTFLSAVAVAAFWVPATVAGATAGGKALFIVFTVLYGAFASAYIALFPASLMELFGKKDFTSVNGALYLVRGLGALLGTPLTGLLIPQSRALAAPEVYERAALVVMALLFPASFCILGVRLEMTAGKDWRWKV
ncbi:MFS general substrate transporter [Aspergillus brunneoviolaceus CBS 621.78]|uniref:MFS general substrate transporter n=1 Tax=Aspergillus brunneoviolaceus CBS 621.78 TaxID=1450534 RepID=A0ACD1GL00_9EURO|nr:MFS general substrate transporter [Aspergillus brunneoviolaceus CBS 621.78]RAH49974.1 MFS general substrate transporter [Aspergillus brunneoviolaceus CBS 621.78]